MKKFSKEWWAELPPEKIGRETEKLVESLFAKWNENTSFAWHRLPDSKAARGYLKSQPADLTYRCGQRSGFIEVKALKAGARLPSARLTQLPTLHKWGLAGADNLVLVFHWADNVWRCIDAKDLPFGQSSWNLLHLPSYATAEEALLATGYFEGIK